MPKILRFILIFGFFLQSIVAFAHSPFSDKPKNLINFLNAKSPEKLKLLATQYNELHGKQIFYWKDPELIIKDKNLGYRYNPSRSFYHVMRSKDQTFFL